MSNSYIFTGEIVCNDLDDLLKTIDNLKEIFGFPNELPFGLKIGIYQIILQITMLQISVSKNIQVTNQKVIFRMKMTIIPIFKSLKLICQTSTPHAAMKKIL